MTRAAGEEPYTGPPPTRRPEPWEWPQTFWQPPPGTAPAGALPPGAPRAPAPWLQAPPYPYPRYPPPGYPPPAVRWTPPPGTPPHDLPRPFVHVMRSRDWAWWRPVVGLLLLGVVYLVAATVVVVVGMVSGLTPDLGMLDLMDPAVLLVTNLSLIVAIPVVWLTWFVAHGMKPGWSSSVLARLRRRLLGPFIGRAALTLGVGIGMPVLLGLAVGGEKVTGPVPSFGWLLLIVLLTTPLQSAAEEYLFRGYLSQAIAGWIRSPRVGAAVAAVATAVLFSLAHLPGDVPSFLDRFAFGLAASAVVWLTGGLEAAIVLHALNNVLVFLLAGALGEGVATEEVPQGAGLLYLVISLAALAAYVVLVARSRRSLRPETHTAAQDLRSPTASLPVPAG